MNNKYFSLIFVGFFSTYVPSTTLAASAKVKTQSPKAASTETPLRQKALIETENLSLPKKAKSENKMIATTLQLKDPFQKPPVRKWNWIAGLRIQQYQPRGRVKLEYTSGVKLEQNPVINLPGLEFGINSSAFSYGSVAYWFSGTTHFSYASQESRLNFLSGYAESNTRLITSIFDVLGTIQLGLVNKDFLPLSNEYSSDSYSAWRIHLGLGYGNLYHTQTSSNSYARFNERLDFLSGLIGISYDVSQSWQIFANEHRREKLAQNESSLEVQNDNLELGTRFLW